MPNQNIENMSDWQILLEVLTENAIKCKLFNQMGQKLQNLEGVVEFLSANSEIEQVYNYVLDIFTNFRVLKEFGFESRRRKYFLLMAVM